MLLRQPVADRGNALRVVGPGAEIVRDDVVDDHGSSSCAWRA
jgi:hypothetical protein